MPCVHECFPLLFRPSTVGLEQCILTTLVQVGAKLYVAQLSQIFCVCLSKKLRVRVRHGRVGRARN